MYRECVRILASSLSLSLSLTPRCTGGRSSVTAIRIWYSPNQHCSRLAGLYKGTLPLHGSHTYLCPTSISTMTATLPPLKPLDSVAFTNYWSNKYIFGYVQVAVATSCLYNYYWNWPREIRCVWQRKLSIASCIFLVNRYATVCYNALGMVQLISWTTRNPRTADQTLSETSSDWDWLLTPHLLEALFAALRTYAIWNQDRRVFATVLTLGLIYPLGYVYFSSRIVYYPSLPPTTGCDHYDKLPKRLSLSPKFNAEQFLYVMGIVANVVFEIVTISLTWAKTIPSVRRLRGMDTSLVESITYVVFRDGTLHFIAILYVHGISVVEFAWTSVRFVSPTTATVTSLLVSRFILDLRNEYMARNGDQDTLMSMADLSDIRFAPESSVISIRNPDGSATEGC